MPLAHVVGCKSRDDARAWCAKAMAVLARLQPGWLETPLVRLACPEFPRVNIFIKDETCHPSGSLKHRLAHALFTHAVCNALVGPDTVIVEASSGSTAISEAWFAQRLGLRFIAVVPASTAPAKLSAIRCEGGEIVLASEGEDICERAQSIADACNGHFMNQFARAADVAEWRDGRHIASSLVEQAVAQTGAVPDWIVVGAGTGGTSATIGRHLRFRPELAATRLCLVDPEHSAFYKAFSSGDYCVRGCTSSIVEGIGRARVEPGFMPRLVDCMINVPDYASVGAAHWLARRTGMRYGPSTGTNMAGAIELARKLQDRPGTTSATIVTLACDSGQRYSDTIYDPHWLAGHGIDPGRWRPSALTPSHNFAIAERLPGVA